MSTEKKIAELRALYLRNAAEHFDRWSTEWTESPIERLLFAQMLSDGWGEPSPHLSWVDAHRAIADFGIERTGRFLFPEDCACICIPQASVIFGEDRYRIDFAFVGTRFQRDIPDEPVRIAVELDGHDFHERTKEQASRDKRRDRVLAANGWQTLRFSGSDVYASPSAVLAETTAFAHRACWPGIDQ